jgi:DNA-binding transcriptional regulator YdaS (Cro superfamily)
MRTPIESLDAACIALGGQQRLADALTAATPDHPCTTSAISQWRTRLFAGGALPQDRAEPVEAVTNGSVRVEEWRPDLLWRRDQDGRVIGVITPIAPTEPKRRRGTSAKARA